MLPDSLVANLDSIGIQALWATRPFETQAILRNELDSEEEKTIHCRTSDKMESSLKSQETGSPLISTDRMGGTRHFLEADRLTVREVRASVRLR